MKPGNPENGIPAKQGGRPNQKEAARRLWLLVILGAICIILEVGVHFFLRTAVGYTHIFYVLLVLAAVWYYKKALTVAGALVVATILTSIYVGDFTWATLLRAVMFLIVTYIVASISEERDQARAELQVQKEAIEEKHYALIGYLTEVSLRMKNPVSILRDNLANLRLQLEGEKPDIEAARMDLAVQITHADQIMANFRELNQAIVEDRDEIPAAYRDFLTR